MPEQSCFEMTSNTEENARNKYQHAHMDGTYDKRENPSTQDAHKHPQTQPRMETASL